MDKHIFVHILTHNEIPFFILSPTHICCTQVWVCFRVSSLHQSFVCASETMFYIWPKVLACWNQCYRSNHASVHEWASLWRWHETVSSSTVWVVTHPLSFPQKTSLYEFVQHVSWSRRSAVGVRWCQSSLHCAAHLRECHFLLIFRGQGSKVNDEM